MTGLGILITALNALVMLVGFMRHKRAPFPIYGWLGLGVLALAEGLMLRHVWPVTVYFTPIAWTGYLVLIDAMVRAIAGRSRLRDEPRRFLQTALVSIPLWLIFEAYNLRLANWTYRGVPMNWAAAALGYGWSFATITPAIFETADLIAAFGWFPPGRQLRFSPLEENSAIALGGVSLLLPLVVPHELAAYLFILVWIGFVLLLDPINHRLGRPSLLSDLGEGRWSRFYSLLISGWICGWFWEFWNYWAAAKWYYVFPIMQKHKIFEMPVAGYLGFLPFALECFAMYTTAMALIEGAGGRSYSKARSPDPRTEPGPPA